jgi:ribosomal protein S18 acetylase RimI-like enzyme
MIMMPLPSGTLLNHARYVEVLTRAFAKDPAARWIYNDDSAYWSLFPDLVHAFAGKAFSCDTVYAAPQAHGVAMWLPPNVEPDELAVATVIDTTVASEKADEVFALFAEMHQHHPMEAHWYLPLVGVDPQHQRRGLGSDLLRQVLNVCDRDGIPAYLEATTLENRLLYTGLGFRVISRIQVGSSPTLFAMLRQPVSAESKVH